MLSYCPKTGTTQIKFNNIGDTLSLVAQGGSGRSTAIKRFVADVYFELLDRQIISASRELLFDEIKDWFIEFFTPNFEFWFNRLDEEWLTKRGMYSYLKTNSITDNTYRRILMPKEYSEALFGRDSFVLVEKYYSSYNNDEPLAFSPIMTLDVRPLLRLMVEHNPKVEEILMPKGEAILAEQISFSRGWSPYIHSGSLFLYLDTWFLKHDVGITFSIGVLFRKAPEDIKFVASNIVLNYYDARDLIKQSLNSKERTVENAQ